MDACGGYQEALSRAEVAGLEKRARRVAGRGRISAARHQGDPILKNNGYATGLVGKWHLGRREAVRPLRHGFDYFWGYLAGYIDWYTHTNSEGEPDLWENASAVTHGGYFGHEVTRRAVGYIADHARQPFFLEVTYGSPHWPYQSPSRASTARDRAKHLRASDEDHPTREDYVAIVEDLDAGVGQIMEAIGRHGLTDNTLVVFMSDNGGEWLSRNAPFFHRKDSLWEGGIRVPAIFRWPSVLPAGAASDQVGITMDVTATILAATATPVPPETRLEGRDLVPFLSGKTPLVERTLYWRNTLAGQTQRAVRRGNWKFLLDGDSEFLFNLRDDPGERNDVATRHYARVREMRAQSDAWVKDVDAEAKTLASAPPGLPR